METNDAEAQPATTAYLREIVRHALAEDLGTGDATTAALIEAQLRARGVIRAKAPGVLSGLMPACLAFRELDGAIDIRLEIRDGARVAPGSAVATLTGRAQAILSGERVALNFLQHLSGIATLTARFVEAVSGTGVMIFDTRKTVPGLRVLEKLAVAHGGGTNHRRGLDDAILVKDNHIAAVGDVARAVALAVEGARRYTPPLPVIVEAHDLAAVALACRAEVQRILLDNFTPAQVAEAIAIVHAAPRPSGGTGAPPSTDADAERTLSPQDARIRIEVSGGITLANVRAYALPGVDVISIGALTHSAPALDLSLELERIEDQAHG
jgi:nicotinate-nucleotide pyrophosphorylase (carboxylating)